MTETCNQNPNWNWKLGETFKEDSIYGQMPFNRKYFDCGIYYFDGVFNVVKFPKGTTIYHGSAIIANVNVEFPVGIDYYKPLDYSGNTSNIPIRAKALSLIATMEESIEEIVSANFNITAGWYGDPTVAKLYSYGAQDQTLKDVCRDKCVLAYKLKKDLIFFLLDDDYNIARLLSSDDSTVPQEEKDRILRMFNINSVNDLKSNDSGNPQKRFIFEKNRKSDRVDDLPFGYWFCSSALSSILKYDGYAAPDTKSTYHGVDTFHQEFIICNAFKSLERDLNNIYDWQYNANINSARIEIKEYIEQLQLYKSYNVNFHAGNLLEHSIWSMLYSEYIMEQKLITENYLSGISWLNMEDIYKLTSFVAFIHDIGKMMVDNVNSIENKVRKEIVYFAIKDHPEIGYKYIRRELELPKYNTSLEKIDIIDIAKLFDAFDVDYDTTYDTVATVVKLHWDFGDLVKKYKEQIKNEDYVITQQLIKHDLFDEYYDKIVTTFNTTNIVEFTILLYTLLVVSISDIYGSQQYFGITTSIYPNINKTSKYYPYIANLPKKYRGGNIAELNPELIEIANEFYEYAIQKFMTTQ